MKKYSVIVPAYNVMAFIPNLLDWWVRVRQTRSDIELIIIDDGSKDGLCDHLIDHEHFDVRVHRQKNQGVSAARNQGLLLAKGHFILFLDADDEYSINIFNVLDQHITDEIDLYAFNYSIDGVVNNIDACDHVLSATEMVRKFIDRKLSLCICALCCRRTIFAQDLYFPKNNHFGEDIYMILKILLTQNCNVLYIAKVLFNYRFDHSRTVQSRVNANKVAVLDLYTQLLLEASNRPEMLPYLHYLRQRTYFYLLKLCIQNGVANDEIWAILLAKKDVLNEALIIKTPFDFQCAKFMMQISPRFLMSCIRLYLKYQRSKLREGG